MHVEGVERRTGLSISSFEREFLFPNRPVVIVDGAAEWEATNRLSPSWFRAHHPNVQSPSGLLLSEIIDRMEAGQPVPYPCHFDIATHFPALARQLPRLSWAQPDRLRHPLVPRVMKESALDMFFGSAGSRFPYLHWDIFSVHAYMIQVFGRKEYILYAPDQSERLYPHPERPWQSMIDNHHDPDYAKWPRFSQAEKRSVTLGPGDVLFVPSGWWHTTVAHTANITIAVNQVHASNWRAFCRDVHRVHRRKPAIELALRAWLAAVGPLLTLTELAGRRKPPIFQPAH